MRYGLIGIGSLLAIMAAGVQPSQAAPRPWCMDDGEGILKCWFQNFQQCYETSRGLRAYCVPNPDLQWQQLYGRTQRPRRRG